MAKVKLDITEMETLWEALDLYADKGAPTNLGAIRAMQDMFEDLIREEKEAEYDAALDNALEAAGIADTINLRNA